MIVLVMCFALFYRSSHAFACCDQKEIPNVIPNALQHCVAARFFLHRACA